jgi:hypothetical protein
MDADLIDATETLLAHLICADASGDDNVDCGGRRGLLCAEFDAGIKLNLAPMQPKRSYTFQHMHVDGDIEDEHDRLYATDARLLLNSVQDLIGRQAEIAMICDGSIKWTGFKKLARPPKGIWTSSAGASLYEVHYREVFADGSSTYYKRVGAISKLGKPLPCVIVGSNGKRSATEGEQLVLAASIIEDAHRPDVFTASIRESAEIVLPVSIGEHKDLFALRDAPMAPTGRRKSILHWVSSHMRQSRKKDRQNIEVAAHLRGIREFSIDGLTVTLSPNTQH